MHSRRSHFVCSETRAKFEKVLEYADLQTKMTSKFETRNFYIDRVWLEIEKIAPRDT